MCSLQDITVVHKINPAYFNICRRKIALQLSMQTFVTSKKLRLMYM